MKNARQQVKAIKAAILARASEVNFLRDEEGAELFKAQINGITVRVSVECNDKYDSILVESVGNRYVNGHLWVRKGIDGFGDKVNSAGYDVAPYGDFADDVGALFESLMG